MNLRKWSRETHRALANQPTDQRYKDFSASDVEKILRMSITVLAAALETGNDLQLEDLGRLWVQDNPAYTSFSNLNGRTQQFRIQSRRRVRFRASKRLLGQLNY